jgi:adenylate kinase family enzyme
VYAQQTEPLLKFYRDLGLLHEIDGTIGVDNVMAAIKRLLDGLGEMKA